ncbi:hypothetical protein HAX54_008464 [Datura stramonium]|uniref:Uncharacterized protein n=1 Tax=Datura stramonium TaxID=4076 RepID=A0ABS8TD81_DATST|nr:hypothetical protein [Datura stramonium]
MPVTCTISAISRFTDDAASLFTRLFSHRSCCSATTLLDFVAQFAGVLLLVIAASLFVAALLAVVEVHRCSVGGQQFVRCCHPPLSPSLAVSTTKSPLQSETI